MATYPCHALTIMGQRMLTTAHMQLIAELIVCPYNGSDTAMLGCGVINRLEHSFPIILSDGVVDQLCNIWTQNTTLCRSYHRSLIPVNRT